jgi:hypothetical protein
MEATTSKQTTPTREEVGTYALMKLTCRWRQQPRSRLPLRVTHRKEEVTPSRPRRRVPYPDFSAVPSDSTSGVVDARSPAGP